IHLGYLKQTLKQTETERLTKLNKK
ncbi:uncharacterized protein METZ01_LOCUS389701, partial [marine metagenome]